MTLNVALFNALSGLGVNQRAIDFTAQNIANANTEGYSRKDVQQTSVIYGGIGSGVAISDVTRTVNDFMLRDMRDASSQLGLSTVQNDFYGRMQDLFGSLSSNSSPTALLSGLASDLQAWSISPEDVSARAGIVGDAQFLTQQLREIASNIQSLRTEADQDISDAVDVVNTNLDLIQSLNAQIAQNKALGQPTSDLEDQRDLALNKISEQIDINYFTRNDGQIVIMTDKGRPLLDGTAVPLSHAPAANFSATLAYDGSSGAVDGIHLGSADITGEIGGGRIAGLVELRDTVLPNLYSQFEELAQTLHDEVNAVHNQGTAFPGLQTMTGTRTLASGDAPPWSGQFRLAVLDDSGTVVETQDFDLGAYATVGDLVTAIDSMTNASASLNADGNLVITTAAGNHLAINELDSAVTVGSRTVGFSDFAGLNDLLTSSSNYDTYLSAQQTSRTAALGISGTLTLSGSWGAQGIAYGAGDSIQDIAAAITGNPTLAAQGISASAVPDGSGYRLKIVDSDGGNVYLADTGTLVSSLDVKARDDGTFPLISVRSDILGDPSLIANGKLSDDPALAAGDVGVSVGDNSTAQALANKFNEAVPFDATGMLSSGSRTFADYAGAILALNAGQASHVSDTQSTRQYLYDDLKNSAATVSGVNIDEEMARLVQLQNSYAACARVVTTTSQLFDILQNMIQ